MITIACQSCAKALTVIGDNDEAAALVGHLSDFYPDKYKCFACEGQAACVLTAEVSEAALRSMTIFEVTPQEAFAALMGMGIPAEMTCCSEVVETLFEKQGIKANGYQIPKTNRYVMNSLTFPDGSTLHLGASAAGALAYRISKAHSYVKATHGD